MPSDVSFTVAHYTDISFIVEVVSWAVAAVVFDAELVTSSTSLTVILVLQLT